MMSKFPTWMSYELALLYRPFHTYESMRKQESPTRSEVFGKVIWILLLIGSFVSFTSAGRLVAFHLVGTLLFWSFAPLIQLAIVTALVHAFRRDESRRKAIFMYFSGTGTWQVFMMFMSAVCILSPDVSRTISFMLQVGILPLMLLLSFVWGGVVTYAFFRSALALSFARAALGTFGFYFLFVGTILSYYFLMNQIQPQLFGVPQ